MKNEARFTLSVLFLVAIGLGFCAGWTFSPARKPQQKTETINNLSIGTRFKLAYSDPVTDRYEEYTAEVVRIVQPNQETQFGTDGRTNSPRAEWRITFVDDDGPHAYFAVTR